MWTPACRSRSSRGDQRRRGAGCGGIPLTHRATARSFAVVTGSTAHAEDTVDLARMATATDTLVVLMAAGALSRRARRSSTPDARTTPAAVVQWAWTDDQRAVVGTLADLPTLAAAANIGPPATLVIGDVVSMPRSVAPVRDPHPAVTSGVDRTPPG